MQTTSTGIQKHAEGSRLRAVIASSEQGSGPILPVYGRDDFVAKLRAEVKPLEALGHIDHVFDAALVDIELLTPAARDAWMESGTVIRVVGWALDQRRKPLSAIALTLGEQVVVCEYGLSRPDLVQAFGNEEVSRCGFGASVDTADLPAGQYDAQVFGIDAHGGLVSIPYTVACHFAVIRPAADFFNTPRSESMDLVVDENHDDRRATTLSTEILRIRGRAFDRDASRPFDEVAAVLEDDTVVRGHRTGGPSGDEFEIVIPMTGRSQTTFQARVVALGPSGRAELSLPPRTIANALPSAFLGMRPLRSAAHVRARMRQARGENGRIDIDRFVVDGHAFDPTTDRPLSAIALRVRRADAPTYPAASIIWGVYGTQPMHDGDRLTQSLRNTGFTGTIDRRAFRPGEYTVEVLPIPHGLRGYFVPHLVGSFTVDNPNPPKAGRRLGKRITRK